MVTCFADELFGPEGRTKEALNCLEGLSEKAILNYVGESDSKMYIGFDFGTIQDAEYFNKEYVSGSTNILHLALTRGFIKLYENIHTSAHNQVYATDDQYARRSFSEIDCELNATNEFTVKPDTASRKKATSREIEKLRFLGANSSGILVRVKKYPRRL